MLGAFLFMHFLCLAVSFKSIALVITRACIAAGLARPMVDTAD